MTDYDPQGPLDETQIVTALRREYDAADSYYCQLRELQWAARDYYEARPFKNEEDGRSQIVLPDVQEAVDYMSASVLRTFVSSDRVVEFEAVDEADEELVDEATAAINYNFMREQDGYRILHDVTVDGLLEKYGVFKSMVTTKEVVSRFQIQLRPDIDPELQLGLIDGEIEHFDEQNLIAHVKKETVRKKFIDAPVPSEEYRFSPLAKHEDTADYQAHVSRKTRSELVEMGFDREQVYNLPCNTSPLDYRRDTLTDGFFRETESSEALQEVLLCEEYARMDVDNDGIAERIKVFRVENEILKDAETGEPSIETIDDQPFSVFSPFPRPHRLVGYSLADKVMDLQLARSTVARQLFDGMYNANMPRPIVNMAVSDENTLDDLLNPVAGSPIRTKGLNAVAPYQTSFDVGKSLQVLEWVTGERESRTGITRLNQGLDADALNKTATGTALMQAQGQQQEEFIARNLAECVGRMFAKKYRLMKAEGEPFKIKVDGQYRMVDPSGWPDDINIVIRVGLGSGSKDKRIQYRMALAPMLAEGLQMQLTSPEKIYNAMDALVRDMGLGTGDDYWVDPSTQPPQQPEGPSAEEQAASAQMQTEQAKLQLQQQKIEGDHAIQQQKIMTEAQLEDQRQHIEAAIAMNDADAKMSQNRPGGRLDQ